MGPLKSGCEFLSSSGEAPSSGDAGNTPKQQATSAMQTEVHSLTGRENDWSLTKNSLAKQIAEATHRNVEDVNVSNAMVQRHLQEFYNAQTNEKAKSEAGWNSVPDGTQIVIPKFNLDEKDGVTKAADPAKSTDTDKTSPAAAAKVPATSPEGPAKGAKTIATNATKDAAAVAKSKVMPKLPDSPVVSPTKAIGKAAGAGAAAGKGDAPAPVVAPAVKPAAALGTPDAGDGIKRDGHGRIVDTGTGDQHRHFHRDGKGDIDWFTEGKDDEGNPMRWTRSQFGKFSNGTTLRADVNVDPKTGEFSYRDHGKDPSGNDNDVNHKMAVDGTQTSQWVNHNGITGFNTVGRDTESPDGTKRHETYKTASTSDDPTSLIGSISENTKDGKQTIVLGKDAHKIVFDNTGHVDFDGDIYKASQVKRIEYGGKVSYRLKTTAMPKAIVYEADGTSREE